MEFEVTKTFNRLNEAWNDHEYFWLQGGAGSGKTIAILQMLYLRAKMGLISGSWWICGMTYNHLKDGAMTDFFSHVVRDDYDAGSHNKSDKEYKVKNTRFCFRALDNEGKGRGPRKQGVYFNEVNTLDYEVVDQVMLRTDYHKIGDFNPVRQFWVHDEYNGHPDAWWDYSTYKDNHRLPEGQVRRIERYKETDEYKWKVYGLGEVGTIEGLVFPEFTEIDSFPENLESVYYGLDYGFSVDPSACIKVACDGENVYLHEVFYGHHMLTSQILNELSSAGIPKGSMMCGDSSHSRVNADISHAGWSCRDAIKGTGSVEFGIGWINDRNLHVTRTSINLITELRNYCWHKSKVGKGYERKPVDDWNHCIDAARYGLSYYMNPQTIEWF